MENGNEVMTADNGASANAAQDPSLNPNAEADAKAKAEADLNERYGIPNVNISEIPAQEVYGFLDTAIRRMASIQEEYKVWHNFGQKLEYQMRSIFASMQQKLSTSGLHNLAEGPVRASGTTTGMGYTTRATNKEDGRKRPKPMKIARSAVKRAVIEGVEGGLSLEETIENAKKRSLVALKNKIELMTNQGHDVKKTLSADTLKMVSENQLPNELVKFINEDGVALYHQTKSTHTRINNAVPPSISEEGSQQESQREEASTSASA